MMVNVLFSTAIAVLAITNMLSLYGFYKLMKINIETEEGSTALREELTSFRNHLETVYNKDLFYGDETLKALLEHARDIDGYVEDFIIDASLPENDYIQEMEINDETAESEAQETKEN